MSINRILKVTFVGFLSLACEYICQPSTTPARALAGYLTAPAAAPTVLTFQLFIDRPIIGVVTLI